MKSLFSIYITAKSLKKYSCDKKQDENTASFAGMFVFWQMAD